MKRLYGLAFSTALLSAVHVGGATAQSGEDRYCTAAQRIIANNYDAPPAPPSPPARAPLPKEYAELDKNFDEIMRRFEELKRESDRLLRSKESDFLMLRAGQLTNRVPAARTPAGASEEEQMHDVARQQAEICSRPVSPPPETSSLLLQDNLG